MENYHTLLNELISGSEMDKSTIQHLKQNGNCHRGKNQTRKQKVCHPKGFEPASQGRKTGKGKGKASKLLKNPNAKEAFLIEINV